MRAALVKLMRLPLARPFVLAYFVTGEYVPLLAMCDRIEESDEGFEFVELARTVRASLLTPRE